MAVVALNEPVYRFRMTRIQSFALAVLLGLFAACKDKSSAPQTAVNRVISTNMQVFQVKGVVKKPNPAEKKISIQHEAVPNYMPAMTMPFNVKDAAIIQDLQPGDQIEFRLNVTDDESWIDEIKKVGTVALPPERPSVRLARAVEPLAEGDMMPDYQFTNEVRKVVKLSDFKGKALAFTFIFTRCPLPEFCPLMQKNLLGAYNLLKKDASGPANWHLMSISFDPHYDTPEVLQNYSRLYPHEPADWSFVSGAMIDIDAITDQFGVDVEKQGDNWGHKLRTVVIDAAGKIQKIFYSNEWKAEELAAEMAKAAKAVPEQASEK